MENYVIAKELNVSENQFRLSLGSAISDTLTLLWRLEHLGNDEGPHLLKVCI